jgi:hypothetical protein
MHSLSTTRFPSLDCVHDVRPLSRHLTRLTVFASLSCCAGEGKEAPRADEGEVISPLPLRGRGAGGEVRRRGQGAKRRG